MLASSGYPYTKTYLRNPWSVVVETAESSLSVLWYPCVIAGNAYVCHTSGVCLRRGFADEKWIVEGPSLRSSRGKGHIVTVRERHTREPSGVSKSLCWILASREMLTGITSLLHIAAMCRNEQLHSKANLRTW